MYYRDISTKRKHPTIPRLTSGFTLIEIIVVIVIIGILAAIVILSYGNWQSTVATGQIKSDLNGVASAMENARTFGSGGYPTDVTSLTTFTKSDSTIILSGGSTDGGKTYCINATSSKYTNLHFYVSSLTGSQGAQQGVCGPLNLTASANPSTPTTVVDLTWNPVSDATGYTVEQANNAAFTDTVVKIVDDQNINLYSKTSLTPDTNYYYHVRAKVAGINGAWSPVVNAKTNADIVAPPTSNPVVTVAISSPTVTATIAAVSCPTGLVEYSTHSRTNGGSWGSYSGWATGTTATQSSSEGVMYGYQAQARCNLSGRYSDVNTGVESNTPVAPISAPSAPVVTAATVDPTTTWSWPAVICTAGTPNYQYDYTVTPAGSDSGWVSIGTNLSIGFTTSTVQGQTYTVAVQAKCVGTYNASSWSGSGSASYYNPIHWKQISSQGLNTCAISPNDLAYCWGSGMDGELGNGSTNDSNVPVPVSTSGVLNGKTIKYISVGEWHTCVIASDNNVYCWGEDTYGQLGDNAWNAIQSTPVAVNKTNGLSSLYNKTVLKLSAGYDHTCVVASDNKAHCWGGDGNGQLGDNQVSTNSVPYAVNTTSGTSSLYNKTVSSISAGTWHTCAIDSTGKAHCWGKNTHGGLGNNSTTQSLVPVAVNTTSGTSSLYNKTVTSIITAGGYHTCAIDSTGAVHCWGLNTYGQVGDNTSGTDRLVPVLVNTTNGVSALYGKTVSSITADDNRVCAIANDSKAYCWGRNNYGDLGDNSTTMRLAPVAVYSTGVLSGKSLSSIVTGQNTVCSIATDYWVYCWGKNNFGQFGNGDTSITLNSVPIVANPRY